MRGPDLQQNKFLSGLWILTSNFRQRVSFDLDFYVLDLGVALIHRSKKGSNSCPSVLPLRFDFHDCIFSGRRFISRFGVCDVWVPRLCFLLFRQGLMKRANVDGVKSICG